MSIKYKMHTYTFTPHEDLKKIPLAFKRKWIEALQTSRQAKNTLATERGKQCCLGVACSVAGYQNEKLVGKSLPSYLFPRLWDGLDVDIKTIGKIKGESFKLTNLENLTAANYETSCGMGMDAQFSDLNDGYLTHPQIAELLKGNSVTIRKRVIT